MTAPPSFTCPVCGRTSYNVNDVRHGYCGNCHAFTGEGPRFSPSYGDQFVEGMFFDPDGKPLSTLQWAVMYEDRFKDLSPGAWWRAGLDLVEVAGRQLEVSTVWGGENRNYLDREPDKAYGMWETAVFLIAANDRERLTPLDQLYRTREQAQAGHRETVQQLAKLAAAPESAEAVLRAFRDQDEEETP